MLNRGWKHTSDASCWWTSVEPHKYVVFWSNSWPELPAEVPKCFYLSVRNSPKLTYILQIIEKLDTMKVHVHLYVRGTLSRCNSTFLFLREHFKKSNRCVSGSVKIPKNTYNRLVSASDIQLCTYHIQFWWHCLFNWTQDLFSENSFFLIMKSFVD
jgi:hypothetical protein